MGQFLGRSTEHAGSVGLIRNLKTNAVTTQSHVVYDDHFSTVKSDFSADNVPVPPEFHDLYRFSRENHYDRDDLIERRSRQLFNVDRGAKRVRRNDDAHRKVTNDRHNGPLESEGANQVPSGPENTTNTPSRGKINTRVISPPPQVPAFDFNDADSDGSFDEDVPSRPAQDINSRGVTCSGKSFRPDQVGTTRSGKSFRSAEASYVFDNSYLG